jgi:metallo-beta-lactamase class B
MINRFAIALLLLLPWTAGAQEAKQEPKIVYESGELTITQLTNDVYLHVSFLETETFGKVECNGMVVIDENEAVVFDTPASDKSSAELITWVTDVKKHKIKGVVCTHFHEDCVGGLRQFNKYNITSYANEKTIELAKSRNYPVPTKAFRDSLTLTVGKNKVHAKFFGEGHTADNVVGYYPKDDVMFGGCLIKALGAGKGNLADANVTVWSKTVEQLRTAYPDVKIVIPGHGKIGDKTLLTYTVRMFGQ